jgi:hypothetical protein
MKARYQINERGDTEKRDLIELLTDVFKNGYSSTINLTINGEYYEVLQ